MQVHGRYPHNNRRPLTHEKGTASSQATKEGVVITVGDDDNPDFWLTIYITPEELAGMLDEIQEVIDNDHE